MKKIASLITAAAAILAANAQIPYKIIAPIPEDYNGEMAYLVSYDTGEKVDSAVVANENACFKGNVDEPFMARVIVSGKRHGNVIVEQGTCTINTETKMGVGTMLNDQLKAITDSLDRIAGAYGEAQDDALRSSLYNAYNAYEAQMIEENIDTPIALFLFADYTSSAPIADALAMTEKFPQLKEYKRVQDFLGRAGNKLSTSEGRMFADFEITYDGTTKRLSDYVGKGDYVLVDFWASWCGPCMREIETLKKIHSEYSDKGLKILGVAVWDKPEDTLGAIKRKQIPWECIINAQTIPTDIYGIEGIPCIILFGPDGTILSRDKQGVDLVKVISETLK